MKKKGAIELSIGTIVILVLAMSMLILGLILVKSIFSGAKDVTDTTFDQLASEIAKTYGDDKKLVIYPNVEIYDVKIGKSKSFAIRIKNLLEGSSASNAKFSYEISPSDFEDCNVREAEIFDWMKGEKSEKPIEISPGGEQIEKVLLTIPEGTVPCTFKIRVSSYQNNKIDANAQMFIQIKA